MRYSGIGGQAVMEGVMMKNGTQYAVAVRKPDGEIIVDKKEYKGILSGMGIRKLPFVRGVVNFIESLMLGMQTLAYSASFYEEEEGGAGKENETQAADQHKQESVAMGVTMACSVVAAVVIFMLVPYFICSLFRRWILSQAVLALLEGVVRMAVFFVYILLISRLSDIQRVFMYHGAEHKCINCIEHGMELNVENVRKSSRLHKRCGTSFLFLVVCISMVFFFFIRTDSGIARITIRLLFVPLIAGCAYEVIRIAGRSDHILVNAVSMPGMALQRMTTKEPDDAMIEVGIASVEAVFDWKAYIEENKKT
ncbi:MAG: DUF1385 domain-containing protein [Eubacterium sp.]|nr:DUF1385 domain-containing protein [Eubacterium sp.]